MPIDAQCPKCGKKLLVKTEGQSARVQCPSCGEMFVAGEEKPEVVVPMPPPVPPAIPPASGVPRQPPAQPLAPAPPPTASQDAPPPGFVSLAGAGAPAGKAQVTVRKHKAAVKPSPGRASPLTWFIEGLGDGFCYFYIVAVAGLITELIYLASSAVCFGQLLVAGPMVCGFALVLLGISRGRESLGRIFGGFKVFGRAIGIYLLSFVFGLLMFGACCAGMALAFSLPIAGKVVISFLLMLAPFYFAIRLFCFSYELISDQDMGVGDALKANWRMTASWEFHLFLLIFLAYGLVVTLALGAIGVLLGVLLVASVVGIVFLVLLGLVLASVWIGCLVMPSVHAYNNLLPKIGLKAPARKTRSSYVVGLVALCVFGACAIGLPIVVYASGAAAAAREASAKVRARSGSWRQPKGGKKASLPRPKQVDPKQVARKSIDAAKSAMAKVPQADAVLFASRQYADARAKLAEAEQAFSRGDLDAAKKAASEAERLAGQVARDVASAVGERKSVSDLRDRATEAFAALDSAAAQKFAPEDYKRAVQQMEAGNKAFGARDYKTAETAFSSVILVMAEINRKFGERDAHLKLRQDVMTDDYELLAAAADELKCPCALDMLADLYKVPDEPDEDAREFCSRVTSDCQELAGKHLAIAVLGNGEKVMGVSTGKGNKLTMLFKAGPFRENYVFDRSEVKSVENRLPREDELHEHIVRLVWKEYRKERSSGRCYEAMEALGRLNVLKSSGFADDKMLRDICFTKEPEKGKTLAQVALPLISGCLDRAKKVDNACPNCSGSGNIDCTRCGGTGFVSVKCSHCGGDGVVTCKTCGGRGTVRCVKCGGRGIIRATGNRCRKCGGRGSYACKGCKGTGRARCKKCRGTGTRQVACPVCGARGALRGKIPCPDCKGTGTLNVPEDPQDVKDLRKEYMDELAKDLAEGAGADAR